ncbi:MAG TPA: AraC family transcriptional regulator [Aquabacterium sp.]|nr:AraC family transcriptional regulator [Aquabacterium sp.]
MRLRSLQSILFSVVTGMPVTHAAIAAETQPKPATMAASKPAARPAPPASGVSAASRPQIAPLDRRTQEIKREVMRLNSELQLIEQELLYPPAEQIAVFVSLDVPKTFKLNAVSVQLDGKPVGDHAYTAQELAALQQGGVQRLYAGSLSAGEHELSVTMTGVNGADANYQRTGKLKFDKGADARVIQLRIDHGASRQPDITVKVWR